LKSPFFKGGFRGIIKGLSNPPLPPFRKGGRKNLRIMMEPHTDPQPSPAELLRRIQARFRERGIFGQTLTLAHGGEQYQVRCDAQAFAVYRLVEQCHLPPGRPGWPVCLVTAEVMVDETSPPHLPEDDFTSGLSLQEWLDLIESRYGV
jgi:hypothetical protein